MTPDRDLNWPKCYEFHPFLLRRIALSHFKSVSHTDIALRPLSVIVGANSSGKSTLLNAIAATVQTIRSKANPDIFALNGELVRLGSYRDILNFRLEGSGDPIMIGFRVRLQSSRGSDVEIAKRDYALDFAIYLAETESRESGSAGIEAGSVIISSDGIHEDWVLWSPIDVPKPDEEDVRSLLAQQEAIASEIASINVLKSAYKLLGLKLIRDSEFDLQSALSESHAFQSWNVNQNFELIERGSDTREFDDSLTQDDDSLPSILDKIKDSGKSPLYWVDGISGGLFDSKVTYLGPLRLSPHEWPSAGSWSSVKGLGARGEHTAAVLNDQASAWASLPMPEGHERFVPIGEALNHWLKWFDLADAAATRELGRSGPDVTVSPRGASTFVDLSSVGVGVSQVLPVILLCLLSKRADVLILEQPELHLHPALQKRMADFLLTFVRAGRQILVETHSDHLVNQLRYQVAADQTDEIGKLVKLIFADQTDGITTYRESEINEYGGLSEDWPDGFLNISAKSAQDLVRHGLRKWKLRKARPGEAN